MSSTIGKKGIGLSSSPPKVEEEANKAIEKQGIVSILGFESNQTTVASLRRTLSADMSSKKWLAQQGLIFTMKKIAFSEELTIPSVAEEYSSSLSEGEGDYEGKKEVERAGQEDVWRSSQSQKEELVEKPIQVEETNHEEMADQKDKVVDQKEDGVEEMEEVFETFEDEEEEQEGDQEEEIVEKVENELLGGKEIEIVMEQASKLPGGVISVHRSALMMKQLMGVGNRNPTWTNKFNKGVNLVEVEEEGPTPLPQSLPLPPRVARLLPSSPAAASFNTYEYFWRTNPTLPSVINPITQQGSPIKNRLNKVILGNSPKAHDQDQQMVLLRRNKADYLVPLFKGCKEPRRSLLIWEPYCIATS
ncbi:hypothetical protein Acr_23g0014690 [Actinidia rufa]|uniref:Uncharacterized protein n=1 Tax=Actinidia rufa TaxID=165716 RepID=A0A7J0GR26_9ERIC|nr:hypothetical protein Acr_23g0014690 [Actinidia rufa]